VRRQQTLRASVDWSHALLTVPERVLFRRLAAFLGGFDLDAAQAVTGHDAVQRFHVLDLLTLLVDKSLVVADQAGERTRYRLLETVRQYALEKLSESGEADAVRSRHRDHYTARAALLEGPSGSDYGKRVEQTGTEIDNMRAAFAWSRENGDAELALRLASSLTPLWQPRPAEGVAWFDAILNDENARQPELAPVVRARALADRVLLATIIGWDADIPKHAEEALAIARELDNPALLARALGASSLVDVDAETARAHRAEAIGLARALGDRLRLSHILSIEAIGVAITGDLITARAAAQEGCELAEAIDYLAGMIRCRWCLGLVQLARGELAEAVAHFGAMSAAAEAGRYVNFQKFGLASQGMALAWQGDTRAARAAAGEALEGADELGSLTGGLAYTALGMAALASGDVATARNATDASCRYGTSLPPGLAALLRAFSAQAALAAGDLVAARRTADDAVTTATGWYLILALTTRARVAIAQGEPDQAERDAHDALVRAADVEAYLGVSDSLECLGTLAGTAGSHREAARLFGASQAVRQRIGEVRFQVWDTGYEASVAVSRDAIETQDFDAAWAEGMALSTEEAIAYAQRGRGQRKRPVSGWGSLTPTERDVVRLVSEGLGNKDIAARLFVSPRTVQTHLTHVYTKLGLNSRIQLVHEAARHS
jgi:DNA-binding CsgD family transcriptional regulator